MKGELGQREEQELERLAKEDSFLAEAYEGLQQLPEGEHARRMQSLRERLQRRAAVGSNRVWPMALAAVLLLLLSLALWLYWPQPPAELAEAPDLSPVKEKRSLESNDSPATEELMPEESPGAATAAPPPPTSNKEAPPPQSSPAATEQPATASEPTELQPPAEQPAMAEHTAADSFFALEEEAAFAREREAPASSEAAPPVAARRRAESAERGAHARARTSKELPASPVVGREAYQNYLRDSLRYPDAARAIGLRGEVALTFEIDQKGRPVRIQVLDSLGYGAEAEAKRLLREGPVWLPPGGHASYRVPFAPPE